MRVVTLIPYWSGYHYENNELIDRDALELSGKVLLNYPIEISNKISQIDETYLFTNDVKIINKIDPRLKIKILERDKFLDRQLTTIENIIESFLNIISADILVLLHPKAPFMKKESIEECINSVKFNKNDSAFLARVERKFSWFEGKRLNYDANHDTPHLSKITPIILETSSAYVFSTELFTKSRNRLGLMPFVKEIGVFEGLVISTKEDMQLAQFLMDSKFNFSEF